MDEWAALLQDDEVTGERVLSDVQRKGRDLHFRWCWEFG